MLYDLEIINEFKTREAILLEKKKFARERVLYLLEENKEYINCLLDNTDKNKCYVAISDSDFQNELSNIVYDLSDKRDEILTEVINVLKDNYIKCDSLVRGQNRVFFNSLYIDIDNIICDINSGLLK